MSALLAVAFGAGLIAPINPCGFALLPALLATCLDPVARTTLAARLSAGVRTGLAVTLGFAGALAIAGVTLSMGLRAVTSAAPWIAVAIGAAFVVAGLLLLTGRRLPLRLPTVTATVRTGGSARLVAFGAGYALASLSCTVGVLLAVTAQALATATVTGLVAVFVAYAAGAATLLLLLAVSAALASSLAARVVKRLLPYIPKITGVLLALSGAYLLAYWLPTATGNRPPRGFDLGALAGRVSTWVTDYQAIIALVAGAVVAVAVVAGLRTGRGRDRSAAGGDRSKIG